MQRIDERSLVAADKPDLVIHDTPELNAETPAHLLDDDITPTRLLFARNTGAMPVLSEAKVAGWTLHIDGLVRHPRTWTVAALQREFETVTETSVMECAGNGRAFFAEPVRLVQWRHGAVGCVQWSGVRLGDLLQRCELLPQAVYTGHHSPDLYLDGSGPALSRGLPIDKALAPETLVAFALNGEPLPLLHGGPLRLVVPGYPGASFQKWLTRIEVRDREHDGERMRDGHYRMPRQPVRPGEPCDNSDFEIITDIPGEVADHIAASGFSPLHGRAASQQRSRLERTYSGRTGRAVVRRRRLLAHGGARSPSRPVRLATFQLHAGRSAAGRHRNRRARHRCDGQDAAAGQRAVESARLSQ
jgi:DMSO/TMAO reductase YedYZ molybdopterin-dependent catalytic subunit